MIRNPTHRGFNAGEVGGGEHASFTGTFLGRAAFHTSGRAAPADFDRFSHAPG